MSHAKPVSARMLTLLRVSTCGYKRGMLKIAGKAGLSPAFAAKPDTKVRIAENPADAINNIEIKAPGLAMGFPNKKVNTKVANRPILNI